MFDISDFDLIDLMGEATRDESTAIAQRLALVAELFVRRSGPLAGCEWWVTDACDAVAAEVAAVQNVSHARAVGQVQFACALWHRLPRVATVFTSGVIDFRVVSMIVARTENVDDAIIAELDESLARHAVKWMKLSKPKLRDRIDLWVTKFDAAAVRVPRPAADNQYVEIEVDPLTAGVALVSARLNATDAAALDQGLDAVASTVCANDPRSKSQRRAAACGALGRREASLACQCGSADCPAAAQRATAAAAVIHVLAEAATLEGSSDTPGYLRGFGILPAESVRQLATTATLKPLPLPADASQAGYRPSVALSEFIKWRDLTCRWPGCDKPAERCDTDHTVPWPLGPTHPSNTKAYCRTHHLIKTFYTGTTGWTDRQLPDGTVILTAPTGHTYTTEPHGATLFPALRQSTGELDLPRIADVPDTDRTAMMPKRQQTREQDRRDRITNERRQRTELIAEEERQRQAWLAANYQPPPF